MGHGKFPRNSTKKNTLRLQLLYDSIDQECVPDCHGRWVTCAKEVLTRNDISVSYFAVCWHFVRERERKSVNKTIFIIIIIIIIIIIVMKSGDPLLGLAKSILLRNVVNLSRYLRIYLVSPISWSR